MRLFVRSWLIALLLVPTLATAAEPVIPAEVKQDVEAFLKTQAECFDHYDFGSVHFAFGEQDAIVKPGSTVTIEGRIISENDYPLSEGTVIARILKEDNSVADRNWHPIIAEVLLPGTYSLPSKGSVPFTFTWDVPARAPNGNYLVEFSYLASGKYVMGGIPYLQNFTAGTRRFAVQGSNDPAAVSFDRSSVQLNGTSFDLRSVPPTFEAETTLTIDANLLAESSDATPVPTRVRAALFAWSDVELGTPLINEATDVLITPGVPFAIPIAWVTKPGAYELVLSAVPLDSAALPSVLKIRFPVEGDVPHVIYSGIGNIDEEKGEATITTCAVNSSDTEGVGGQLDVAISADGKIMKSATGSTATGLSTVNVTVALADISKTMEIAVEAKNGNGDVTDKHKTTYKKSEIKRAPLVTEHAAAPTVKLPTNIAGFSLFQVISIGGVLLMAAVVLLFLGKKKS